MGHFKTKPQVNQEGQPSGQLEVEITYGGLEAPFGGLDTSAPPAYIDPHCVAQSEGFLVVDNRLVLASLNDVTLPILWQGAHPTPLLFGNYYDSRYGQLNYALGVSVVTPGLGGSLIWLYTYYLTLWDTTGNLVDNVTLTIKLWQNYIAAMPASITFPILQGEASTFADTGVVGIDYGASSAQVGTVTVAYAPGDTVQGKVTALVAAINGAVASTHFNAAPTPDGFGITLTAVTPGTAGNLLCIADASGSSTIHTNAAFYIPYPYQFGGLGWTFLNGGQDIDFNSPPVTFPYVSATAVGGVLYFANLGPVILKYKAVGEFNISSAYSGITLIRKFAGSLIGLGTIPALGVFEQNANMIFAWSAAENLDEWNPVDSSGNVTGAGFAQLADIDDQLNGLIVTNNTAFILRAQGISYATATGSGTDPFQFAHIGLADNGEGAQNAALVTQYDQTGAYVGNAEIFQISGSISAIGKKINSVLFQDLQQLTWPSSPNPLGADIVPSTIGGDNFPLLIFMIGTHLYTYNTTNKTWMYFSTNLQGTFSLYLGTLASLDTVDNVQILYNATVFQYTSTPFYTVGAFELVEGTDNTRLTNTPSLTFPQEELLFGRDVTIDSLYIALNAVTSGVVTLNFYFNDVLYSTQVLDPAVFNSLTSRAVELKIFPSTMSVFTSHSPQLKITISFTGISTVLLRFTKIQIYATTDPNQRPV